MRKSFSMIYAIVTVVILASLGALIASLSSASEKNIADKYLKSQMELYKNSALELAVLWLHHQDKGSIDHDDKFNISFDEGAYEFNLTFHKVQIDDVIDSNGSLIVDIIGTIKSENTLNQEKYYRISERKTIKP